MKRADGFSALLNVIDKRMGKFGPDDTVMMGEYQYSPELGANVVVLDTGQVIPNPVTLNSVVYGRYPCAWMQGGHDIVILTTTTPVFGCLLTPVTLGVAYTPSSFSSTPDGTQLVVIAHGENPFGLNSKYVFDTSDYSTVVDSAVLSSGSPLDPPLMCIAGDDGYFYYTSTVVLVFGGDPYQYIWRWPIIGAGGAPDVFATYTGADYFSIRDTYNMTFDTFGHFYIGGKDGPSGEAVLLSLDRTTGARTTLHQDPAWEYFEPSCCTLDGAVWGWAIVNTTPPVIWLFRFDGAMSLVASFPDAFPRSGMYPLPDSSVAFLDGDGNGKRCDPSLAVTDFDCLDFAFSGDHPGPNAPTLVVPNGVVANAALLTYT